VFRVRAGFVCGLCGRLHENLEPAFDCLGRCTIELRLRTPAGRALSGEQGHYACTACGRGFANTDDAEDCFERCLSKMKPSPQFEEALRRVQVKYVQRLQAHGLRSLSKIDAFAEHTRMLETLKQEQRALGRPVANGEAENDHVKSTPVQHSQPQQVNPAQQAETTSINQAPNALPAETPDIRANLATAAGLEPSTTAAVIEASRGFVSEPETLPGADSTSAEAEAQALLEGDFGDVSAAESLLSENFSNSTSDTSASELLNESSLDDENLSVVDKSDEIGVSEIGSSSDFGLSTRSLSGEFSDSENSSIPVKDSDAFGEMDSLMTDGFSDNQPPSAGEQLLSGAFVDRAKLAAAGFTDSNNSTGSGGSDSALSILASSEAENASLKGLKDKQKPKTGSQPKGDFENGLSEIGINSASKVNVPPVFNKNSEEPETNALAADVLALLQTTDTQENLELNTRQAKDLNTLKVNVDTDLLDKIAAKDEGEDDAGTLYLRLADMKPYRRNNAKYCCSACGNEFFTKEQVEACFFGHPEEGSEEAKVLLAKGAKIAKKSAA